MLKGLRPMVKITWMDASRATLVAPYAGTVYLRPGGVSAAFSWTVTITVALADTPELSVTVSFTV